MKIAIGCDPNAQEVKEQAIAYIAKKGYGEVKDFGSEDPIYANVAISVAEAVAAGEYDVGVCLDYVTANIKEKGSPIEFVYPEDTVSIFSPIGRVKNAKNMENGKLLYDFILSKEGQEIIVAQNLLSVRAGIQQKADVAAIAAKAMASDMKDVVEKEAESKAAFDKIFR